MVQKVAALGAEVKAFNDESIRGNETKYRTVEQYLKDKRSGNIWAPVRSAVDPKHGAKYYIWLTY